MKVLIVEPGIVPYEKEINGLKEMQAVVGGSIQAIYPFSERLAVVCNEEGLINDLPFNRSVPGDYGGVFGTFFVCGVGEETFCSLTSAQMETYKKQFQKAEILLGARETEPITMKVSARDKGRASPEKNRDTPPDPSAITR